MPCPVESKASADIMRQVSGSYDPEVGRFISADALLSTGQGILGYNMYAYCGNNPVVRADAEGTKYYIIHSGFGFFSLVYKIGLMKQGIKASDIEIISVNSEDDFVGVWNALGEDGEDIDGVMIVTHGEPYSLKFKDESLLDFVDVSVLLDGDKTINNWVLLTACSAGHDDVDGNMGVQFAKITNGTPVFACDGAVGAAFLDPRSNDTFRKNCVSPRDPQGWRVYQLNGSTTVLKWPVKT